MGAAHDDRVTELEVRLAFIDDALMALTEAEAQQTQRMQAIERTLAQLRVELDALRTALAEDVRSEPPPPHY